MARHFGVSNGPEVLWPTVEHYYQAAKAQSPVDSELIRGCYSPSAAKKLGRTVKIVKNWDEIKLFVMRVALVHKFTVDNKYGAYLMSTAPHYLQEGNWWNDLFWGTDENGIGMNWLGHLLMAHRAVLLAEYSENGNSFRGRGVGRQNTPEEAGSYVGDKRQGFWNGKVPAV